MLEKSFFTRSTVTRATENCKIKRTYWLKSRQISIVLNIFSAHGYLLLSMKMKSTNSYNLQGIEE